MASRIALAAADVFWVVINGLLWQAEWGDRDTADTGLPPCWIHPTPAC